MKANQENTQNKKGGKSELAIIKDNQTDTYVEVNGKICNISGLPEKTIKPFKYEYYE